MLLLLENGVSFNSADGLKETLLYAASKSGHEGIVRLLLKNDANITILDGFETIAPLPAAVGAGHTAVVELLLAKALMLIHTLHHHCSVLPFKISMKPWHICSYKMVLMSTSLIVLI